VGALAAELFADSCPPATMRTLMGSRAGFDRSSWLRWTKQTGLAGIGVPEELGGGGFPLTAVADVFEAAGSTLVCAPLLSVVGLAAPVLVAAHATEWLAPLCAGELVATLAMPEPGVAPVRAEHSVAGWSLTGQVPRVVDGETADLLLVAAGTADGPRLFAVETAGADGLRREPLMSLDLTRRQAAVTLDGVRAVPVGPGLDTGWLDLALDDARVLLAAELVGVAQRCLDTTVGYVSQRVQFGRPIGSFQAVKHQAAQMLIGVELARSAARHAAESATTGAEDREVAAALAKAFCAETAVSVGAVAIQLHGGIGFTWDHDVHLLYKRAIGNDELLGGASGQWARVSAHLDRTQ
jgi:alkylation response protein AidB-like acyl-CoA dehydrogenase